MDENLGKQPRGWKLLCWNKAIGTCPQELYWEGTLTHWWKSRQVTYKSETSMYVKIEHKRLARRTPLLRFLKIPGLQFQVPECHLEMKHDEYIESQCQLTDDTDTK